MYLFYFSFIATVVLCETRQGEFLSFLFQDQKLHSDHKNWTDRPRQQASKVGQCNWCLIINKN